MLYFAIIDISNYEFFIADQSVGAGSSKNGSGNGNHVGKIVGITISTCVVLIFLVILVYSKRKKTRTLKKSLDRTGNRDQLVEKLMSLMYFYII